MEGKGFLPCMYVRLHVHSYIFLPIYRQLTCSCYGYIYICMYRYTYMAVYTIICVYMYGYVMYVSIHVALVRMHVRMYTYCVCYSCTVRMYVFIDIYS